MTTKFAALFALLAGTSCAYAEDVNPKWKDVGGWSLHVDRTNYGCFMMTTWERGTIIRLGFDSDRDTYMYLSHASWQSLERGKKYSLTMKFDDQASWSGPAIAGRTTNGNTPFLSMTWDKSKVNFLQEFAASQGVTIWYGEKIIAQLRLSGSYAAIQELDNCQRTIDASRSAATSSRPPLGQRVSDPFRESGRSDPFGR